MTDDMDVYRTQTLNEIASRYPAAALRVVVGEPAVTP